MKLENYYIFRYYFFGGEINYLEVECYPSKLILVDTIIYKENCRKNDKVIYQLVTNRPIKKRKINNTSHQTSNNEPVAQRLIPINASRPNDKVRAGGLFGRTRLCEALLDDFGEHFLDVQPCGTYLLGDEAGGGHAWCGVDLQ